MINNAKTLDYIIGGIFMKKTTPKFIKPLIFILIALVIIGVFYYCSRKKVDNNEEIAAEDEISVIVNRDLTLNYPSTPKSVVTFYSEIIKTIYKTEHTDEQLQALAGQARGLFDEELLKHNEYSAYMDRLRAEVKSYKDAGRFISGYQIEDGYNIEYIKSEGKEYAKVNVKYYVREGKNVINTYEEYTLRKDEDGKWRILYWELSDAASMEE